MGTKKLTAAMITALRNLARVYPKPLRAYSSFGATKPSIDGLERRGLIFYENGDGWRINAAGRAALLAELDAGKAAPAPEAPFSRPLGDDEDNDLINEPVPAAVAIAADAPAFGIGDKVVIKLDAPVAGIKSLEAQKNRTVGIVRVPVNHKFGVTVSFSDDYADLFLEEGWLDLWKPADAPVSEYHWTPAELAQYSPDNPYPPYTPGGTADDTIAIYEYEAAALKQQIADMQADRLRLQRRNTALEDAHDRIHLLLTSVSDDYQYTDIERRIFDIAENALNANAQPEEA